MNPARGEPLETWSARLADGETIDWDAARKDLPEDEFKQLRKLAELAGTMRRAGPSELPTDARWGHLELRGSLGRGSFGEVLLAFDPILQREVALKLRRDDAPDADPALWIAEARQLARVRHPNVLAVHGADVQNGVPGLWADRVEGTTLRDHVRSRVPPFAEVLQIARQLAGAVAAIHAHGLAHGDLKPGNVMIEPGGRVVLMDFGAARPQGAHGHSAGSPVVMSPERLAGSAPSGSDDIHALGAVFAFLASGRYPYAADSVERLRSLHERQAPPDLERTGAPRAWRTLLRAMLASDPESRPSIEHVVVHLDRLHEAPMRRRRRIAAGTIMALLAAGLAIAVTGYVRVRSAESETSAVNDLLRDVLIAPRGSELGREARIVDVLERALPEAERRFADQPLALARVRALLGRTLQSLGLNEDAEPLLRAAYAVYVDRLGARHPRTASLLDPIARVEHETGRLDAAEATWNRMLKDADPVTGGARHDLIYAHIGLASLRIGENRLEDALAEVEQALALHLDDATGRAGQSAQTLKALVLHRLGRSEDAVATARTGLDASLRLNGQRHVNTLIARDRLIEIQLGRGDLDAAERLARDNLAVTLDWLGEGERRTVMAQNTLSNVLADRGRADESLALLEAASRGARDAYPPDAPDPFVIDSNRAARYLELDRAEDAVRLAAELDEQFRLTQAPVGQLRWVNALNLAEALYWTQRFEAARAKAGEIGAEIESAHGEGHPLARIAASYRAAALNRLGRPDEAAPLLDPAHAALAAMMGQDHPQVLLIAAWQAETLVLTGRPEAAIAAIETVLERAGLTLEPGHYRLRDLGRIADRVRATSSSRPTS